MWISNIPLKWILPHYGGLQLQACVLYQTWDSSCTLSLLELLSLWAPRNSQGLFLLCISVASPGTRESLSLERSRSPSTKYYKHMFSHHILLSTTSSIMSPSKTTGERMNSHGYLIQEIAKGIRSQMVPLLLLRLAIPLSQTSVVVTLAYERL